MNQLQDNMKLMLSSVSKMTCEKSEDEWINSAETSSLNVVVVIVRFVTIVLQKICPRSTTTVCASSRRDIKSADQLQKG